MLNRFFLGLNSEVEETTDIGVDRIKSYLSKRLDHRKTGYLDRLSIDYQDVTSKFVYSIKGTSLTIHSSKSIKVQFRNSFQGPHPWFAGNINGTENQSTIKGTIGVPEWTWWTQVIWFFIFGFIYYGWTRDAKSFPDGDIAIYFILFGLLFFLINIAIMRNRVDKMREEIDVVVENAR
ncbi:MAG: hypothetical protein WKF87_04135 [Chryseolinea sp.]